MARHKKILVEFPSWLDDLKPNESCLRSVAEDAYYAKALAEAYGASADPRCSQPLQAAVKSMRTLENSRASQGLRCKEGDRAARKFWEAKVCARAPRKSK